MTEGQPTVQLEPDIQTSPIVNDFSITFGTINGSGSQTANVTLLRALCHMGIPVSGKNIFPSNIQGQPTWYTIRLSKDGFIARREEVEILVAMNPMTFSKDLASIIPGGVLFYADDIKNPIDRDDIVCYPMPVKRLAKESDVPTNLRDYVANMVYVGVVAQMLGIELENIYNALNFHFKGKERAVGSNYNLVKAAAEWAEQNLEKRDPYRVEPMAAALDRVIVDGNTAGALGAVFGGVQFAAWYPITPASSMSEALNEYLPLLRRDTETGKNTFAVVQAEDELAAIGMCVGAGWAGMRSMTATSGPGLSLMTEYTGLAYYAEVPVVIWDIQRVGPSTGLPTRTAQGDLTGVYSMSHGDTKHIMIFPSSMEECFEFGWKAFDLAERLQTPIFVMSDLDLGMNYWMSRRFEYPDKPMDRGKVLWEDDLEKLKGEWARYLDADGDGIPYRTIPGNRHPRSGYFTRGTGHDENAHYTEDPEVWERMMERLVKKYDTARSLMPEPCVYRMPKAEIGIIAVGSTDAAIQEAQYLLGKTGMVTDYLRLRSIPFGPQVADFVRSHKKNYVVELNRDGQLHQILSLEIPELSGALTSVCHLDGLPLTARWIKEAILAKEEK